MVIKIIIAILLFLVSCGNTDEYCTRKDLKGHCTGNLGPQGSPGFTSLIKTDRIPKNLALCDSGSGVVIQTGIDLNSDTKLSFDEIDGITVICDGVNGINGTSGVNGKDGINGTNGKDAAVSQYDVVGLYDPCGKQSNYDEVLLRLADNTLLAAFTNGGHDYLSQITPGTYITVDNTNCYFTVNSTLNTSNEHN